MNQSIMIPPPIMCALAAEDRIAVVIISLRRTR